MEKASFISDDARVKDAFDRDTRDVRSFVPDNGTQDDNCEGLSLHQNHLLRLNKSPR
jgi:hypothetical protein